MYVLHMFVGGILRVMKGHDLYAMCEVAVEHRGRENKKEKEGKISVGVLVVNVQTYIPR